MNGAVKYFGEWQQRSVVCEPLRPGDLISLENKLTYDLRNSRYPALSLFE